MTIDVVVDTARAETQQAFLGLLVRPLVTADADPTLLREVSRHRSRLTEWVGRLGYRLVVTGRAARLHRDPSGPQRTAAPPPWDPPSRRDLVLLALAVAACEGTGESTTVQDLSDEVRGQTAGPAAAVMPYDPDRRAERQALLRALDRLAELGVLIRRTSESLLRQWEEDGTGVGGGFEVNLDALLQFSDPHTVELALSPHASSTAATDDDDARLTTRAQRLLRTLVEDVALLYADLHPADADYARARRSWLAGQAVEMTGGTVELRAEGLVLLLPTDRPAGAAATAAFPAASATPWFALVVLDAAIRRGPPPDAVGRVDLTADQVDAVVTGVFDEKAGALTKALEESPDRLRAAVEPVLVGLGLVQRMDDGAWSLQPTAGRFRDPAASWAPTLANEPVDVGDDGDDETSGGLPL